MPTLITEQPYRPVPVEPARKRWTREEFTALTGADLGRLELIDGELIDKMGKNRPHTVALIYLKGWLVRVFGLPYVNPETPIDVSPEDNPTNEPQPDIYVLNRAAEEFMDRNPQPENVRLLVEISDSSLGFDLTKKAELYARAGIVEYWVLDVAKQRLVVHREPAIGHYTHIVGYGIDESVSPLAAPHEAFPVREAFPQVHS